MLSRSAITKMKAVLIIDLLIVAVAAGTYIYLQNQGEFSTVALKPASFKVTDLSITPSQANVGQPVVISVKVINEGEEAGTYSLAPQINGVPAENQTVTLEAAESTTVEFTATETGEGTYIVTIGDLTQTFTITAASSNGGSTGGKPASINGHNLIINPNEAWAGDSVKISGQFTNYGDQTGYTTISLRVNGEVKDSKDLELAGGATYNVDFTITAGSVGTYSIKLATLSGTLNVVPNGMHTLRVSAGGAKADYTIDGKAYKTPTSVLLSVGKHTIVMPLTDPTGTYRFLHWEDSISNTNPTRTITLTQAMSIDATYEGGSSCPSLYYWNGTNYVYVAEVSNGGWLGYMGYMDENGSIVYLGGNPWDHAKIDPDQLQLREVGNNSYYDMILTQRWNEIFYLDAAYLLVVDHPSNVDAYATLANYMNPNFADDIYTMSKSNIKTPISAVNEKGENVLSQISRLDGIFTAGTNGPDSPAWNDIQWNQLTLDLADLSNAPQIKLIINGMVDWGPAQDYYNWIAKFDAAYAQGLVPNGTQITPPPYMEVKNADGQWVRVPADRELPIPADYVARTFAVDLTGIFPAGVSDYQIRISNFWNVTFDYIGIDTSQQTPVSIQRIDPQAKLDQVFDTPSVASGNFTKYGDVTQLLSNADNMFVIGRQGDEVSLLFPADNLTPPTEGMERNYFLFVADWFKDAPDNWGYGFNFAVDPLPFEGMSGFPYPPTESYPYDAAHLEYIKDWNTRVIPASDQLQSSALTSPLTAWISAVTVLVAVFNVGVIVYFRKRTQ